MFLPFCLPKKVTKKGPENDYTPFSEGALIKLLCYCSLRFSSLIVYHYLPDLSNCSLI